MLLDLSGENNPNIVIFITFTGLNGRFGGSSMSLTHCWNKHMEFEDDYKNKSFYFAF